MPSIIEELQRNALNPAIPVEQLLLKAKVVASKLRLDEFGGWVDREMTGYDKGDVAPDYRYVRGQVQAYDSYSGWKPVIILNKETRELLSSPRAVGQPIGQVEHIAKNYGRDDALSIPLPLDLELDLSRETGFAARVTWRIDPSSLVGIVNAVRRLLLEWSLKLEAAGIKGEGVNFSEPEKKIARDPRATYQINGVQNLNVVGDVRESATVSISQSFASNMDLESVRKLADEIKLHVSQTGLSPEDERAVNREIEVVGKELANKTPDQSRIRQALASIRHIMEGVASNVIASGIVYEIAKHIH